MFVPIFPPDEPPGSGDRRFFYSPKNRRPAAACSTLESDYRLLLEFDADVVLFCEQPAIVCARIEGRWHRSRLDYWVLRSGGREFFVEVKHADELSDPTSRAHRQIKVQKLGLASVNKEHRVVTDREIWANPILNNSLRTLFIEFDDHYPERLELARPLMPEIVALVANDANLRICDVLSRRPQAVAAEVYRMAVFELLRLHQLEADVHTVALSPTSILRVGTKEVRQ